MKARTCLVLVTMAVAVLLIACGGNGGESDAAPAPTQAQQVETKPLVRGTPTLAPPPPDTGDKVVVEIKNLDPGGSGQYDFDPSEVTVYIGETVVLQLSGETERHSFVIDEFEIDEEFGPDESAAIELQFNTAGMFRMYCRIHQDKGLEGTLTVRNLGL